MAAEMIDCVRELTSSVGAVLPLAEARQAHEMLEGLRPTPRRGKTALRAQDRAEGG